VMSFFAFPPRGRSAVYTTNACDQPPTKFLTLPHLLPLRPSPGR
jgi:hypothetical protein